MVQVGIADLKARLSHYLGIARAGEDVLVTDRGRPVARLTPLRGASPALAPHLLDMERRGEIRTGAGPSPQAVGLPRPQLGRGVSGVQALLQDRDEGR